LLQLLIDLCERRGGVSILQPPDDRRREVDDAIEILVVDLVRVRRLWFAVRAGEKLARNAAALNVATSVADTDPPATRSNHAATPACSMILPLDSNPPPAR
jgi:hypothetical protein